MTQTVLAWLAGILAILLVVVLVVEEIRIHEWESDYKTQGQALVYAQDDLATSRANVATLRASIETQNKAIAKLKQDAIDAAKNAADRLAKALAVAKARYAAKVGYGPAALNPWMQQEYGGQK